MEPRNCPYCQRAMEYRLGEWECPICGTTLPGSHSHVKDQIERHFSSTSSLPQYSAPSAPPPPPRGVPGVFQGDYDEHGRYQPRYAMSDEKAWLFWTAAVVNLLPVLAYAGLMIWIHQMLGSMGIGSTPDIDLILTVIWVVLALSLAWHSFELWVMWQILHSDAAWLRYGCGCGSILRIIASVACFFGFEQQEQLDKLAPLGPWAWTVYLFLIVVGIGYHGWLLSVIQRDLRNMGRL